MRVMAKITMGDAANEKIADGSIGQIIQSAAERWKPEAMYFCSFDGRRTGYMVFDMADSSDLPEFSEPFFRQLDAQVQVTPAMNGEDLQQGLSQLS